MGRCFDVDKFLRRRDVEALTGLCRSAIYRRMREEDFPQPRDVGGGAVRWVESEVREWMDARPARKTKYAA